MQDRAPLKHPIVLVHGATAAGSNLSIGPFDLGDYWLEIPQFLGANGTAVKVLQMPTDASVAERAAVLKNYLETDFKGEMVNIVAHSLGGLDARYCATVLGSNQIYSITTIGTPHLGSPLADWAWDQAQNNRFWYWLLKLMGYDLKGRRFLQEITTTAMKRFNDKVPNRSDVRYFSVRTRARLSEGNLSGFLIMPAKWLEGQGHYLNANGNDGLVPFDSQQWGEVVASVEIDHMAQMNHHEFRFNNNRMESLHMWTSIYDKLQKEGL